MDWIKLFYDLLLIIPSCFGWIRKLNRPQKAPGHSLHMLALRDQTFNGSLASVSDMSRELVCCWQNNNLRFSHRRQAFCLKRWFTFDNLANSLPPVWVLSACYWFCEKHNTCFPDGRFRRSGTQHCSNTGDPCWAATINRWAIKLRERLVCLAETHVTTPFSAAPPPTTLSSLAARFHFQQQQRWESQRGNQTLSHDFLSAAWCDKSLSSYPLVFPRRQKNFQIWRCLNHLLKSSHLNRL